MEKVGFIGLGNMGGRLCRRIISCGFETNVYDKKEETLNSFSSIANVEKDPEKVLQNSDVIFLSLPSSSQVEPLVNSFVNLGVQNKIIVDTSTSYPISTQNLALIVEKAGGNFADLPLSGTTTAADEGRLLAFFGGQRSIYEKIESIAHSFADKYVYMGDHGAGHTAKLIFNYISLSYVQIYASIFPLAEKMGLDNQQLFKLLSKASTNCDIMQFYVPKMINRTYDMAFALELAHKDLSYCKSLFEEFQVPAFSLDGTLNLLRTSIRDGKGKMDYSACIETMFEYFAGK